MLVRTPPKWSREPDSASDSGGFVTTSTASSVRGGRLSPPTAMAGVPGDLATLLPSWARHLRAANLSPRTVQSYTEAGDKLAAFLTSFSAGGPTEGCCGPARRRVRAHIQCNHQRDGPCHPIHSEQPARVHESDSDADHSPQMRNAWSRTSGLRGKTSPCPVPAVRHGGGYHYGLSYS